tara:strand:- start:2955 stop:3842 length:888 start_codon:yes stop_codon:yes gene_type:complete
MRNVLSNKILLFVIAFLIALYFFVNPLNLYKIKNSFSGFIRSVEISISGIPDCTMKSIQLIPSNSTVIIGHAYGKPNSKHKYLEPKIENFILKNQNKIEKIIFTGDIFKFPSQEKWNYLKQLSKNTNIKFFIAPGNHDVGYGSTSERDLFNKTFKNLYPISFNIGNSFIIIDDTTISPWNFQPITYELAKRNDNNKKYLFLFGHHIAFGDLAVFANSFDHRPKKNKFLREFSNEIGDIYEKIYVVSGDTGAHSFLPSTSCIKLQNISQIANGVGGKADDEILVLSNDHLFRFSIK